jgi:hypothetical protein
LTNDDDARRLSPRDENLVLALAAGQSVRDAAQACGMSRKTAERRLKDPPFREALKAARAAIYDESLRRGTGMVTQALDVLGTIMNDKTAPATARVNAAARIIETAQRLREADELTERVARLEEAVRITNGGRSY